MDGWDCVPEGWNKHPHQPPGEPGFLRRLWRLLLDYFAVSEAQRGEWEREHGSAYRDYLNDRETW